MGISSNTQEWLQSIDNNFAQAETALTELENDSTEFAQDMQQNLALEARDWLLALGILPMNGAAMRIMKQIGFWNHLKNDTPQQFKQWIISLIPTADPDQKWENIPPPQILADALQARTGMRNAEATLQSYDPAFKSFDQIADTLLFSYATDEGIMSSSSLASQDFQTIEANSQLLFQAMQDELSTNKVDTILSSANQNDLSSQQLSQYAMEAIAANAQEHNDLSSLNSSLGQEVTSYSNTYNTASENYYNRSVWNNIFGLSESETYDRTIMYNASHMINALSAASLELAPLLAKTSISAECTLLLTTFRELLQKIKAILSDTKLTGTEKLTKILNILMYALGIFSLMKQKTTSLMAHNENKMCQANINASTQITSNIIAEEKIQEEQIQNEKMMGLVMRISDILLGAIFTAMAPGLGSAMLMGTFTALEASGAINRWTQDLASDIHSQIGADAIMAVCQMGATALGGAALDIALTKLTASLAETAATDAASAALSDIKSAVEAEIQKQGLLGNAADAEKIIEKTARSAAQIAAKGAARNFFNQSFFTLRVSLRQSLLQTMTERAAKEAVENVIAEAKVLTKDAIQAGNNSVLRELLETRAAKIATQSANKSIANVTKLSLATVEKQTARNGVLGSAKTAAERAGWAGVFSLGSTNLLTDSVTAALGKKAESAFGQALLITTEITQMILQMIAFLSGSGITTPAMMEQVPSIMKFANMAALIPQTANAGSEIDMSGSLTTQANATEQVLKNQAIAELLNTTLKEIQDDFAPFMKRQFQDLSLEIQSQNAMAGNLSGGLNAAAQALSQMAV